MSCLDEVPAISLRKEGNIHITFREEKGQTVLAVKGLIDDTKRQTCLLCQV